VTKSKNHSEYLRVNARLEKLNDILEALSIKHIRFLIGSFILADFIRLTKKFIPPFSKNFSFFDLTFEFKLKQLHPELTMDQPQNPFF